MEFWGIDRSKVSLRLKALERLGKLDAETPGGELKRFSAVLSSPEMLGKGKLPMNSKEYEILVVLAQNAPSCRGEERTVLAQQLAAYLLEFLSTPMATRSAHSEYAPWHAGTKVLTRALLKMGEFKVFEDYTARAQELWNSNLGNDQLVPFTFSLRGFFEGLSDNELSLNVAHHVFNWTRSFLTSDFMSSLHAALAAAESHFTRNNLSTGMYTLRLFHGDTLAYPGPTQLGMAVASFVRNAARCVCGVKENTLSVLLSSSHFCPNGPDSPKVLDSDFLQQLGDYSAEQVQIIESGYQFRIQEFPQLVPLSSRAMWYYFEAIGAAAFYDLYDADLASSIVTTTMETDQVDSRDDALLNTIRLAMVCWRGDEAHMTLLVRCLSGYLGAVSIYTADKVGSIFVSGVLNQPQSLLISTIYTLVNSLNIDEYMLRKRQYELSVNSDATPMKREDSAEPFGKFAASILHAVVSMVITYDDPQIHALTITVLSQKYNSVSVTFDVQVLKALALLAPHTSGRDFEAILNQITNAERDAVEKRKDLIISTVESVRTDIATLLKPDSPNYYTYLDHLLSLIVSKGETPDVRNKDRRPAQDSSQAAKEATLVFAPLATLLPGRYEPPLVPTDRDIVNKFRDAWLNLVVLGFSNQTEWTTAQQHNLLIIARSTPPLVMEASTNQRDSDLELNPVLRRGSTHSNVTAQRKVLGRVFNRELRTMSFLRLMFISATIFLEQTRARAGIISRLPHYFGDADFREGDGNREMHKITIDCTMDYISHATAHKSDHPEFDLAMIADQLREILILCCHRIDSIRKSALEIAHSIVSHIPSALCHKTSMFALLDLLTLMWQSCVDAEEDEYEPQTTFKSKRSGVEIHLSDFYEMRRHALKKLLASARAWSDEVLKLMSEDLKSILTFYLDDLETDYHSSNIFDTVALGRSFALELGGRIQNAESIVPSNHREFSSNGPGNLADGTSGFLSQYLSLSEYKTRSEFGPDEGVRRDIEEVFTRLSLQKDPKPSSLRPQDLRNLYVRSAQFVSSYSPTSLFVAKNAVHVPFRFFSGKCIKVGLSFWIWMYNETPELRMPIMQEIADHWTRSIDRKIGLFSRQLDSEDPMYAEMKYSPTEKKEIDRTIKLLSDQYEPHSHLINFFKSGFHATVCVNGTDYIDLYARIITVAMKGLYTSGSLHAMARTYRMELIKLGLDVLSQYYRYRPREAKELQNHIINAALSWYNQTSKWAFGGNLIQQRKDMALLRGLIVRIRSMFRASTLPEVRILQYFLEEELNRLEVWYDPLGKIGAGKFTVHAELVETAWSVNPEIAVYLLDRNYDSKALQVLVNRIIREPLKVIGVPKALQYLLQASNNANSRYILYWAQSSPLESINLFNVPSPSTSSFLLQYTMRSLESHEITTCFFYVPQIVQLLRHDQDGYVEEYILEAAKFSQLFAHQIIWNILANSYRDDDSNEPDPMKPTLDRVVALMMDSFTDEERDFYDREFGFFNEVTGISGKLKPYIKKSKAEKKAKIDEEMAKIELPEGVYLPSHPLGVVVDIDRDSGRPLQSHAKAPFLAKFKILQEETDYTSREQKKISKESWQGAIFKVGDDCRQDVLAIQIIAVFQNIFNASGLDTFVFPYKVTATAPGCGVIDVLPNSISRDMLGREAVNGLYEWFITKHGTEESIAFQRARNNFVKSMAAYSIISYLLQFKDRHNGNIMYDDDGHVIHIDFGFCFDIVPGGVKFEAAPFKLTKEMVAVMGGSPNTQAYKWFEELCVKAFLTCRLYAEDIIKMVEPMLESGLPCFKPETIKRLRGRFVLQKTEREAAQYVRSLIRKSYESTFTTVYDEFQRITNGIPY